MYIYIHIYACICKIMRLYWSVTTRRSKPMKALSLKCRLTQAICYIDYVQLETTYLEFDKDIYHIFDFLFPDEEISFDALNGNNSSLSK